MEIKIGAVACMREELAAKVTGLPENNKFLITALTDHSVTIRSLADNETHSLRVDSFAKNLKWWEDLKQPSAEFNAKIKKPEPEPEPTEPSPEPIPNPEPAPDPEPEPDDLAILYKGSGRIRAIRLSAPSSFSQATQYDDPYGDPYGGIYG